VRFQTLRETEERTEFALRAARIGVWERDLVSGRVTYSDGMSLVFGRPLEQLPSRWPDASELIHPDDRAAFDGTCAAGRVDQPGFFHQIRLFWPNESVHWADIHGRFLRDQHGRAQRVIGIAIDVTERKELAAQLQMAQKMEAIGQLAGGIAHDFNNLLTAILGYSSLLLERFDVSTPNGRAADRIRQAGEIASGLTRQLLAFSRRQVLQPQVLQVNVIVERMKDLLGTLLGEHINLVTTLAPALAPVSVDPVQLQQIIMNLGINARDAMPDGGQLTIETANIHLDEAFAVRHRTVVPGPYVMLAVSDTGVGMDKNTQAHIFEPFFTTKARGKGTGLGLATVYGIVKQSGGSIWVYSEPQQGTTFKVFLPPAVAPHVAAPEEVKTHSLEGRETILLVEDQPEVRQAARDMLARYGYTVIEAARGQDALQLIAQSPDPVHLLLTDVVMPSMTGRELAGRLVAARPDIRVLYMSGYTNEAIVRHGVLEPGVAFLQKPFTPPELARRVREVLDAERPPSA
jgi:signal transduction histidine kinase/ActR/RegA family two-component response regulator